MAHRSHTGGAFSKSQKFESPSIIECLHLAPQNLFLGDTLPCRKRSQKVDTNGFDSKSRPPVSTMRIPSKSGPLPRVDDENILKKLPPRADDQNAHKKWLPSHPHGGETSRARPNGECFRVICDIKCMKDDNTKHFLSKFPQIYNNPLIYTFFLRYAPFSRSGTLQ
jgi:hypothetical protein